MNVHLLFYLQIQRPLLCRAQRCRLITVEAVTLLPLEPHILPTCILTLFLNSSPPSVPTAPTCLLTSTLPSVPGKRVPMLHGVRCRSYTESIRSAVPWNRATSSTPEPLDCIPYSTCLNDMKKGFGLLRTLPAIPLCQEICLTA